MFGLSARARKPKTLANKRGEGILTSSDIFWTVRSPRIARRDVLKSMTAAGLAAGLPVFPTLAQEKPSNQPALAETLASYAANLKYEDIPDDVVRITKRTILDTVGCAFGGFSAGPSKIAIKLAGDVSAKQRATVLDQRRRRPAPISRPSPTA